ncbi:MAG: sugar phosphate isomerase/epimerase [Planctomycetota bacterium]|jgi:sugar phosphate isomerase/epimerase|nr:sugar phosphate isomerase/epimerase [Planctomycetota bacterium]
MTGISICTASTPWTPLDELIPLVKAAGCDGIEIGLNDTVFNPSKDPNPWGNNAAVLNWDGAVDEAHRIKAVLDANGLACAAVGSYVETDDITRVATAAEVAHALGCEFIRVRVPWYRDGVNYRSALEEARATYRDLSVLSAETGIDSLIELHDNSICPTASAAMRILEGLDPSHVGVIYDPGNFPSEGFESLPMTVDLLGPYLRHVHVKNMRIVTGEPGPKGVAWRGEKCALAEGVIDWAQLVSWLSASGYQGWYSLENFVMTSAKDIAPDVAWLRGLLAQ